MAVPTKAARIRVDYQLDRHGPAARRRKVAGSPESTGAREVFAVMLVGGLVLAGAYAASDDPWVERPATARALRPGAAMTAVGPARVAPEAIGAAARDGVRR